MSKSLKPLIAISGVYRKNKQRNPDHGMSKTYIQAILAGGGIPVILPNTLRKRDWPGLVDRFDGFVFAGGGDVDPIHYGAEKTADFYGIDPKRDKFELGMLELILASNKPLLAICRGCQVLNVCLGGTLIGDIKSQHPGALKHDWYPDFPREKLVHRLKVTPGSLLAECLGCSEVNTNSLHHQSVLQLGEGLLLSASAEDGIIEGIELPQKRFVLGVQWHPEELFSSDPAMLKLFKEFVAACH